MIPIILVLLHFSVSVCHVFYLIMLVSVSCCSMDVNGSVCDYVREKCYATCSLRNQLNRDIFLALAFGCFRVLD